MNHVDMYAIDMAIALFGITLIIAIIRIAALRRKLDDARAARDAAYTRGKDEASIGLRRQLRNRVATSDLHLSEQDLDYLLGPWR